jgi:hypothetical protein
VALVRDCAKGKMMDRGEAYHETAHSFSPLSTAVKCIVRKQLGLEASLYQILQILSLTLFEKTPILCTLQSIDHDANLAENANQLILFDF